MNGPIHEAFGLTYAAYAVFPRVLLCEMPEDWQRRFLALMGEFEKEFPGYDNVTYNLKRVLDEYAHYSPCALDDERERRGIDEEDPNWPPTYPEDPLSNYRYPHRAGVDEMRVDRMEKMREIVDDIQSKVGEEDLENILEEVEEERKKRTAQVLDELVSTTEEAGLYDDEDGLTEPDENVGISGDDEL